MRRLISILILALFCNVAQGGFGGFLQANTAVDVIVGPFIDDTDGKTAETLLTITQAECRISKNGANTIQKNEATSLTHDELGNYVCKFDTTDTNTEGILTLMIHESGALAVKVEYQILAQAAYISFMTAKDTGFMGVDTVAIDGGTQSATDLKDFADAGYNPATDKVTGVLLTDTITTYTGNTKQTADNDTLLTTIDGKVDTAQADLDTITGGSGVLIDTDAVDADALKTDAVTEIWSIAMTDMAVAAPSATAAANVALNWIFSAWRNQTWSTATEITIFQDDASTELVEATISDDATTFKRSEIRAPN